MASPLHFVYANQLAIDDAQLEGKLRVLLYPGRQSLGQRDRIAAGVSHRRDTLQSLQSQLHLGSLGGACRKLIFEYPVPATCAANHLPQLKILRYREFGEGANNCAGRAFQLVREVIDLYCFFSPW